MNDCINKLIFGNFLDRIVSKILVSTSQVDFVLYSTSHQRVLLRIHCGGGHRSWDYMLNNGIFSLAYIRDKQIHSVNCELDSLALPAIQVAKTSGYNRCMNVKKYHKRVNDYNFTERISFEGSLFCPTNTYDNWSQCDNIWGRGSKSARHTYNGVKIASESPI